METVKQKYKSKPDEYLKLFSYRKGSKLIPFTKVSHIARIYRKIHSEPRFWDYEEEEESDEEVEEIEDQI